LKALTMGFSGQADNGQTPEMILDFGLKMGPYAKEGMSLEKLKKHPNGIDLGPLQPCLPGRLQTPNDHINLAPEIYLKDIERLKETWTTSTENTAFPFVMIGRRLLRTHNTWTHNAHRLVKGDNACTLLINPSDAANLNIENKQMVKVNSKTGSIEIEVKISDEMMEGVVSIPQGWGRRKDTSMSTAAAHPGVSINDLTEIDRVDTLTGNAAFNGVAVSIEL